MHSLLKDNLQHHVKTELTCQQKSCIIKLENKHEKNHSLLSAEEKNFESASGLSERILNDLKHLRINALFLEKKKGARIFFCKIEERIEKKSRHLFVDG